MTIRKITIVGADVPEYPNEITKPDYPISFTYDDDGTVSVNDMAHKKGIPLWEKMHGEKVSHLYYRWE